MITSSGTAATQAPPGPPSPHPVLAATAAIDAVLKDVADVDPMFMPVPDKQQALVELTELDNRLTELRLRVLASAEDVAVEHGARDAAAWLAHQTHLDRGAARRDARLAGQLACRWTAVAAGLGEGRVNTEQAQVIIRALEQLPEGLDPDVVTAAEARLVAEAARFDPRQLRILGRRILAIVAPEVVEDHERRLLEAEERAAARHTFLRTRTRGDGTTDLHLRVSDLVATRLLTYLEAFTSPRQQAPEDRRPYDQRLGHAFGQLLETLDPDRLPLHGGDATTMIVTIDLETLRGQLGQLGQLGLAEVDDQPITAEHARRLACTANLIPAVLGGQSQPLDLGRARRLFSPSQRKAMAIRDKTCRAEGCDIPAAWTEAHHAGDPWSQGGHTNLADGALLCSFHHHRAHDHHYEQRRLPDGTFRFHRRT